MPIQGDGTLQIFDYLNMRFYVSEIFIGISFCNFLTLGNFLEKTFEHFCQKNAKMQKFLPGNLLSLKYLIRLGNLVFWVLGRYLFEALIFKFTMAKHSGRHHTMLHQNFTIDVAFKEILTSLSH